MSAPLRVCIDRILPESQLEEAARRAIAENPQNAPRGVPFFGMASQPPRFMALLTQKRWRPGRTLKVRFLEGHPDVQQKVERHAHQWSEHANIKFRFGSDPQAEIRIAFQRGGGSWSYLGTDALLFTGNEPTMNYGWLEPDTPDEEYSRVVVHEFGHALGCIHEHQNPAGGIQWNKEVVYRYFMGPPNNWSREDVDNNMFRRYSADMSNFTAVDPQSIMMYPIPRQWTLNDFEAGTNSQLSATDKEFIRAMYPPGG